MAQSPSDITGTSPAPFSPFSTYSGSSPLGSELATSDDAPDLGAFANVFRELELDQSTTLTVRNVTHPVRRISSSVLVTPSDESATTNDFGSVAWSRRRVAAYLSEPRTIDDTTPDNSASASEDESSDTEAEMEEVDFSDEAIQERSPNGSLQAPGGPESSLSLEGKDQPSLGYLDEVLSFLAEEAAQHAARHAASSKNTSTTAQPSTLSTLDSAFRHVVEPKRKRRRKKSRHAVTQVPSPDKQQRVQDEDAVSPVDPPTDESSSADPSSSFDISSSSYRNRQLQLQTESTPATPPRNRKERRRLQQQQLATAALAKVEATSRPQLSHSRSTPALRLNVSIPLDPRILRLRALAHKLRMFFPEDAKHLSRILSSDSPDETNFVDPRGPKPAHKDSLIHVFVDHSNILFGLLSYIKRRVNPSSLKKKHISHAALALILERGRPVTRRCLVASSPLYQPMDTAEQLGYEVKIYARVPDTGDGADRVRKRNGSADLSRGNYPSQHLKAGNGYRGSGDYSHLSSQSQTNPIPINGMTSGHMKHAHKRSSGGGTSESDHGRSGSGPGSGSQSQSQKSNGHVPHQPTRPGMLMKPRRGSLSQAMPAVANVGQSLPTISTLSNLHASGQGTPSQRVKYREQGVDELLQLKLLQAIAESDPPPTNATIVLATGDGNVGQFNDQGFIGCVRTALKKGWKVELYAWEDGLSQLWMKEFGSYTQGKNGGGKGQFRIVGMQQFASDLLVP